MAIKKSLLLLDNFEGEEIPFVLPCYSLLACAVQDLAMRQDQPVGSQVAFTSNNWK